MPCSLLDDNSIQLLPLSLVIMTVELRQCLILIVISRMVKQAAVVVRASGITEGRWILNGLRSVQPIKLLLGLVHGLLTCLPAFLPRNMVREDDAVGVV